MSSRSSEFLLQVAQDRPIRLDAQLRCGAGELLALVGPSGSGKSTLLRMICGLSRPGSGSIRCAGKTWFDGAAGVNLSPQQRRIGYVPQQFGLFPHLTTLGNVTAGLGHLTPAQRLERAREWIARVHLQGLEQRRPAELSGGQQQRVALARALAREPSILLLDEPFSAVDSATRENLYAELAELKQGLAIPVVMVTHDLTEALLLADRMSLLEEGKTLQGGVPVEVLARPVSVAAARLMGLRNILPARLLRHEPDRQRSWIEAGMLQLACAHRPEFAVGTALHVVLPNSAIRLPGVAGKPLPESPNRAKLRVEHVLRMGEDVRMRCSLPAVPAQMEVSVRARLADALGLSKGGLIDVVLEETSLHLVPEVC